MKQTYEKLKNILSKPVTLDQESEIAFTGRRDPDLIILSKISDDDLVNV
ncbi:unnamed protein product, partial [marine sediment metagenome]